MATFFSRKVPIGVTDFFHCRIFTKHVLLNGLIYECANMINTAFGYCSNNIIKGDYDDTLPNTTTDRLFYMVWIDCHLYESTVPVLEWLTDKMVDGAVICFDDWFSFNGRSAKDEQQATSKWMEKIPRLSLMPYQTFHWSGKSFLFHK